MTALVYVVAVIQAGIIALFGVLALSGDDLGIARAMALLMSLPFAVLTLPALLLLRINRGRLAGLLAAVSLPATWLLWRFA